MPGRRAVTIKGQFGSAEFAENYRAAAEGKPIQRQRFNAGTFNRLGLDYLGSATFASLAKSTRGDRRYCVEALVKKIGHLPVADLNAHYSARLIERYKPGMARLMLGALRALVAFAIKSGDLEDDPTRDIKRPKLSKSGWHNWSEEEIAQFEARHPIGTKARLAFDLALYTGQRASDLIRMGRQHVRDNRINVVQQKTEARLWVPLDPRLRASIEAALPPDQLTFLVTEHGKPFTGHGLGRRMRTWASEAGLTGVPLHGLRKACLRRLAEAGRSANQIAAVSGHKSLSEVERYTRAADQVKMADEAIWGTSTTHAPIPWVERSKKA
jgi:integrase